MEVYKQITKMKFLTHLIPIDGKEVYFMFKGNRRKGIMYVYKIYRDIRLVGSATEVSSLEV